MSVTCKIHGRMQRDEARCWWTCAGFDGEGCESWITDEDIARGISEPGITVS